MAWSMWFRRRPPAKSALKTPDDEAASGRRRAGGSSELPKTVYPVDRLLNDAPSSTVPQGSTTTAAVQMRRRPKAQFGSKPFRRGLAAMAKGAAALDWSR